MYELIKQHSHEKIIKKSRFLVKVKPVKSIEESMNFLSSIRDNSANHNCWAFKTGKLYRFSDDGEPGGTAGKPILTSIENCQIDNIIVVITRYFGGIKLGTGGLVRAYSACTTDCLKEAQKEIIIKYAYVKIKCPFKITGQIHNIIKKTGGQKLTEEFSNNGITFIIKIDRNASDSFKKILINQTHGNTEIISTKESHP